MNNHLWETKHPYYFSQTTESIDDSVYESWDDFLEEFGESDMDYNLVVRWDWQEEEGSYKGDPYYRQAIFKVCFVAQRKGFCWYRQVKVCRADEPAILEWLKPRAEHLMKVWEPLLGSIRLTMNNGQW